MEDGKDEVVRKQTKKPLNCMGTEQRSIRQREKGE